MHRPPGREPGQKLCGFDIFPYPHPLFGGIFFFAWGVFWDTRHKEAFLEIPQRARQALSLRAWIASEPIPPRGPLDFRLPQTSYDLSRRIYPTSLITTFPTK